MKEHALKSPDELKELITAVIPGKGEYIHGFGDMTNLLKGQYASYRSAFVVGKIYNRQIIDGLLTGMGPTEDYYLAYNRMNKSLSELVHKISLVLQERHIRHLVVEPTIHDSDIDSHEEYNRTLSAPFSHKMAATRAGLGWVGKTDLFISTQYGPRLRLSTILLETKVAGGTPIEQSRCGSCDLCVRKCPGEAANGRLWYAGLDRDEFYDPFKCRAACKKLSQERLGKNISLCGICITVCPVGKKKVYNLQK